jgi:hypothetical protein
MRRSVVAPPVARAGHGPRWLLLGLLSALLLICLPGCNGCFDTSNPSASKKPEEEKEEREKKKKKAAKPLPDFTLGNIQVQPSEVVRDRAEINYVKRGHWVAAAQIMRANNFDVPQAELRSLTASGDGVPFDIEFTNYAMSFSRPVSLPKGQGKPADSIFFIPRERTVSRPPQLRHELLPQQGNFTTQVQSTPVLPLDEWQYLFVVLSSRPAAFNILEQTQTFSPTTDNILGPGPSVRYYQLLRPSLSRRVPLPANPLAWTSIAVLLWDDIDPAKLDPQQQQALIDWLHWGGQLVISGPNSLDRLKGTFLEPYLPARNKRSVNLTPDSFNELNAYWSLYEKKASAPPRDLKLVKDIAGIELELAPHGAYVAKTGQLVAEGRAGRGRVVITAFSLASGAVQTWPNFDGFLNGVLLRRPSRIFEHTKDSTGNPIGFETTWSDREYAPFRHDARLVTNLRYFARDMGHLPSEPSAEEQHPYTDLQITTPITGSELYLSEEDLDATKSSALKPGSDTDSRFGGYLAVPRAGAAGWNDFSGTVNVARRHLNDAAGVTIPKADFVARVLLVYLLVLVPVNWLVFRAIGRVEWAWVAAPVIAIVGAVTVIRLAQLDIGFARSRTEIDVVEMHGGYPRAHVSRFIALYTSLASGYDLVFEDTTALAQPLAVNTRYRRGLGESPYQVHLRRDSNVSFAGFQVRSNSTGSIHAEQMYEAGGALELLGDEATGWRVKNGTALPLRDAGIFRRTAGGECWAAYVAELPSTATASLTFRKVEGKLPWVEQWESTDVMAKVSDAGAATGDLRLGRFAELAVQRLALLPGDVRLVAWSPQEVAGVTYAPDAAQVKGISFVLCHLRRGAFTTPQRDVNVLQDVATPIPNDSSTADPAIPGSQAPSFGTP